MAVTFGGGGVEDEAMETWIDPLPFSNSAAAPTAQESGWWKGGEMVRVNGVVTDTSPDDLPVEPPSEQIVSQATSTFWLGLAVTVTVTVSGLVAVPSALQIADLP